MSKMIIKLKNDENMADIVRILVCEGYDVEVTKEPHPWLSTGIPTFVVSFDKKEA